MENSVRMRLRERLDLASRWHPWLMLLAVILMAVFATLVVLATPEGPVVLYQAF